MATLATSMHVMSVVSSLGSTVRPAAHFSGLRACPSVVVVRHIAPARASQRLRISCVAAPPETVEKVRSIIATQLACDVKLITPEKKFTELGADSLDTVEIMMALEEQFDISLDEDGAAEKIGTVQEAADVIYEKSEAAKA